MEFLKMPELAYNINYNLKFHLMELAYNLEPQIKDILIDNLLTDETIKKILTIEHGRV